MYYVKLVYEYHIILKQYLSSCWNRLFYSFFARSNGIRHSLSIFPLINDDDGAGDRLTILIILIPNLNPNTTIISLQIFISSKCADPIDNGAGSLTYLARVLRSLCVACTEHVVGEMLRVWDGLITYFLVDHWQHHLHEDIRKYVIRWTWRNTRVGRSLRGGDFSVGQRKCFQIFIWHMLLDVLFP